MTERESREPKDILGTRPNGRGASYQLAGRRTEAKNFHPRRESKENVIVEMAGNDAHGRPTSSDSSSDQKITSPQNTRIPRPLQHSNSRMRRQMSFADEYKLAEEKLAEEQLAARGSPSPAPRSWRAKEDAEKKSMQSLFSQRPIDFGHQRRAAQRRSGDLGREETLSSIESAGLRREDSVSDIDRKLKQYQEDQKSVEGMIGGRNGLFSKTNLGPKVAETGHELARKTSNKSLKNESSPRRTWGSLAKPNPDWLKRVITSPGKDASAKTSSGARIDGERRASDDIIPSIEQDRMPLPARSPKVRQTTAPPTRSPNKSFAWQAEEDFTAGDLQISNSPPVKPRRSSTKLDDLKRLEIGADRRPSDGNRFSARTNTKLDELRQLEIDAASRFPSSPPQEAGADPESGKSANEGNGQTFNQLRRTNTKLDEIRAREIESLSRKALATARLDELRERNSKSPSLSPEVSRKASREGLREPSPSRAAGTRRQSHKETIPENAGELVPNTPVTIFRSSSKEKDEKGPSTGTAQPQPDKGGGQGATVSSRGSSQSRDESRDLLRRLSRVASNSPGPEDQIKRSDEKLMVGSGTSARQVQNVNNGGTKTDKREGAPEVKPSEHLRPTVGFAGLRRDPSTDSLADKRSSMAHSDSDPIERIEGEMKLFAPLDNQSERGSIRAPSPDSEEEEEEVEATPRPQKQDPLSLPTPKVTGAYVETPATIKIEKAENILPPSNAVTSTRSSASPLGKPLSRPSSISPRASREQVTDEKEQVRTRSAPSRRSRSRSLPRNRSRLTNSAKPPSVKDDLQAIHRENQIEDSTLDDLAELLVAHDIKSADIDKVFKPETIKTEEDLKSKVASDRDEELETYERMTQSLKTGLVSIHTAKQGIERLEHKVSHPDLKLTSKSPTTPDHHHTAACPQCLATPPDSMMYIHVPIPRLYHTKPNFRFTLLGLLLFLSTIWYAAESALWSHYGYRDICYGPCTTPQNAPRFGYVIPVKLDEWTTGGIMRPIANHWREELSDMYEDAWDWCTETDILQVDRVGRPWMNAEQRIQLNRRLAKKGLLPPFRPDPEILPKIEALARARADRERADEAREMGYDVPEGLGNESMDKDEPLFEEEEKSSRWW